MIASILHGFLASVVVSLALATAAASGASSGRGTNTALILGLLVVCTSAVIWIQTRRERRRAAPEELERYDGIADLLIHLHTPARPDRPSRWTLRGLLSWALSSMGIGIGPEGIASELSQAVGMNSRTIATRWSDLRRRTDAAQALAAGISAGFGAPFAAVLLPAELSIGGRVLSSVLASISAYVGVQYFTALFGQFGIPVLSFHERLSQLWGFRWLDAGEWGATLGVCVIASVLAVILLPGLRLTRQLMDRWGQRKPERVTLVAGLLLLSVVLLSPSSLGSIPVLFESVVRGELSVSGAIPLAGALFLVLAAVYSGFGSMGVWWPSFLLGALISMLAVRGLSALGMNYPGSLANAVLLGAVAWTVAWFRTPISLSVLAYELSGNGSLLLPALAVGWGAREIGTRWGGEGWIQGILESKQFPIREGRSLEVMKSLRVEDAMVRDFEAVREADSIESCHRRILDCRYPFLAVVDDYGVFKGLLTVDLIERGMHSRIEATEQTEPAGVERLTGLLEARDLLYHAQGANRSARRAAVQAVSLGTPLSELSGLFTSQLCVPVLSNERKPIGLVFPSDVRQAYDRELARISFIVQARAK